MLPSPDIINTTIDRAAHTVLVVDDNPATRYSTARVIRAAGFKTAEAGTGAEALALARTGVSAVVLDVDLPDTNGFEVCRILRSQAETELLPVVHLSAIYAENEDRVAGFNAGADAYLIHPAEPAVLIATLQALIRARMAEDKLRRSETRFRAIYSQAQSGMCLIDEQGRFADVNPAFERLLGRPREQLLGQRISDLAPPEWLGVATEHTGRAGASGTAWGGEFPLVRADGAWVFLEWRISAHVEPGLRVGIALDISERAQLEQRRREMLEREQAARAIAERLSRTKDDFIAVLSHELRTPLNSIVGWVHILKRRGGSPELLKGLEAIDRGVKTQARIISDILDVSRINSGKLRLEQEWCDPAELVSASVASLRESLQQRKLAVTLDLGPEAGRAWLDPTRFQQIFWNLLTNAIKFSPKGGEIKVGLHASGGALRLRVQDFGPGIEAEFMDHLFDRFTQSDAPGNRYHGGLGLGLSIVKHLVELHGGEVTVDSELGKGTTMGVTLPLAPAGHSVIAAPAPGERAAPEFAEKVLQGADVLVVEDDADACEMLSMILADRGARVRTGRDFESAMRQLREGWPDVLVSDIGLPGRDGYELMRLVREATPPGQARLPAIALTAFSRAEDEASALEAGFDAHLSKPLKPHELIGAVARMLRLGGGHARSD
ncbi:response regulator [Ramlibacter sp.]|uniref:hybrid sensor histidine kinase/response regulator n=1 Tax=Ramlibacter sp. TaxID=1917967 RepID=UPI002CCFECE8|nr:response regulator [Ramlibacter sp.]HWI82436.1 response regulator [Ramlibacter sp.]